MELYNHLVDDGIFEAEKKIVVVKILIDSEWLNFR
jgi:hypothetical protein